MCDRHLSRTSFYDKRPLDTRFRHHDVIATLAHDLKAFKLENLDRFS